MLGDDAVADRATVVLHVDPHRSGEADRGQGTLDYLGEMVKGVVPPAGGSGAVPSRPIPLPAPSLPCRTCGIVPTVFGHGVIGTNLTGLVGRPGTGTTVRSDIDLFLPNEPWFVAAGP